MTYKTKSLNLLLSPSDEVELDVALKKLVPSVVYIDGQRWPTELPPTKPTFLECQNSPIYLWDPTIDSQLPTKLLADGRYQGPSSGMVIQYCRCRVKDNQMASGSLGIGFKIDDKKMSDFVTKVWKAAKSLNTQKIVRFVVGKGVNEMIAQGVRIPELPKLSQQNG